MPAYPEEMYQLVNSDEEQLMSISEKFPWCSSAQLFLLHHYKKNNSPRFEKQASKTALFFNNPAWLQWQLLLLSKEEEIRNQNIINQVEENLSLHEGPKVPEPVNAQVKQQPDQEVIAFEPLHTVDYFASQGIKISDEPAANDKLGNQMKSFTEWLKSMKKINKETLPAGNEETDKTIQHIAENSNTNAEILTEAMADVLVKQKKIEKAIEVYHKLSLINPSKSGYFATKINSLKSS